MNNYKCTAIQARCFVELIDDSLVAKLACEFLFKKLADQNNASDMLEGIKDENIRLDLLRKFANEI